MQKIVQIVQMQGYFEFLKNLIIDETEETSEKSKRENGGNLESEMEERKLKFMSDFFHVMRKHKECYEKCTKYSNIYNMHVLTCIGKVLFTT